MSDPQNLGGGDKRGPPLPGRAGGELPPGEKHLSCRSGIAASPAQVERVAQARLVLGAAGARNAGGGGAQRQALAENAGPGRVFTDDGVETGERRAGEKRRFGFRFGRVDRPRPAGKRPRRGGRKALDSCESACASMRKRYSIAGAFGEALARETAGLVDCISMSDKVALSDVCALYRIAAKSVSLLQKEGWSCPFPSMTTGDRSPRARAQTANRKADGLRVIHEALEDEPAAAETRPIRTRNGASPKCARSRRRVARLPVLDPARGRRHPRLRRQWIAALMVIDTSAIVAIVLDEPEAPDFERRIAGRPVRLISAGDLPVEAAMVIEARRDERAATNSISGCTRPTSRSSRSSATMPIQARRAWRRFGKGRHPASLNFGDCFSYALAALTQEPLLFKGEDFAKTDIRAA